MANNVINSDRLQSAVSDILNEYGETVTEAVNECVQIVADKATAELKTAGSFKGRKYRGSWTNEVNERPGYTDAVVFNKRHYRLTHLLEFGHAKQNGGRTRAFEHIAPVNDKVAEMFETELKKKL
jgi:hypothetical protein